MRRTILINYIGDSFFIKGLSELNNQLGFEFSDTGAKITAEKCDNIQIVANIDYLGETKINYYDVASFFKAFSLALQGIYEKQVKTVTVKPLISRFGTMQNCSTAVMSVPALKELIRQHALMGYNYMQIYTETTYEIPEEPYFGHMKGRYSVAELKDLVAYSRLFGVELVPCIQTIGHMSQLFKWGEYGEIHDIKDIMLVEHPRTYKLIDNMLKTLSEIFDSKAINLGMDEAYYLGFGRYHWFVNDTKPDNSMLFIKHLKKVLEIAKKYGYTKPAIWFDNLLGINFKGYIDPPTWLFKDFKKEITDNMPEVQLIYWNYVVKEVSEFDRYISYISQLSKDISFASMAHGYTSFAPENYTTKKLVETAVNGSLKNNIDDIMVTWWGSIISPFATIPSLYDFAERSTITEGVDFEARSKFLFGYTYEEFCTLDLPNKVNGESTEVKMAEGNNAPFYMLANDPLLGMLDRHTPKGVAEKFKEFSKVLDKLSKADSMYSYIFKFEKVLCDALAAKSELGINIKQAYDNKDKASLKKIVAEIPSISKAIKKFHKEYKSYYYTFNKSFGWEAMDSRLGGLILRLDTVKDILKDYINGKISNIEELDQDRLPVNPAKDGDIISYRDWAGASSSY